MVRNVVADNRTLVTVLQWLIIILMPFLVTLVSLRIIVDYWDYPGFEYGRIEPDLYGFTPAERLELAHATLDYLQRPEPADEAIIVLEALRLPGSDQPLYNEREIGHMRDVKAVVDELKRAMWFFAIGALGALLLLLLAPETRPVAFRALKLSGAATMIAVGVVLVFILVAWGLFFTLFHNIFFDSGTWQFALTDGLIRLFPEKFWFDFALIWTGSILVSGAALALIGLLLGRRAG